jgi:hypothetical protein
LKKRGVAISMDGLGLQVRKSYFGLCLINTYIPMASGIKMLNVVVAPARWHLGHAGVRID